MEQPDVNLTAAGRQYDGARTLIHYCEHAYAVCWTFSAYDTATGKLEGEEGTIGLVQAFLFAGARTVAASL